MTDYLNAPMNEVVADILADGLVDAHEIEQLRQRLYADSKIDTEEAEALFQINDAIKGNANSSQWQAFFTDAICDYLLKDETSPGEVDEDEGAWLIAKLEGDGEIDPNEKALLAALKTKAKSLPANLTQKMTTWDV